LLYKAANVISGGRITTIFGGFPTDPIQVTLVHQARRVRPLKRRAFLDFVLPRLSQTLAALDDVVARA
jgi:hypothetical protein